ncbi:MAG: nuclear transport factor 2 family protein [Chitinophagaceae bacterium]|nr:nuclear transport factor 2 family protein [Chitinophagaceae bacterium]
MKAEEELILFGKQRDEAMVSNNAEEIAKFMSDDWVIVGTEGGITSKSSFLEWIKSGDVMHSRMDSDEIRVKIYGNTGVVTSRGTSAENTKDNSSTCMNGQRAFLFGKRKNGVVF